MISEEPIGTPATAKPSFFNFSITSSALPVSTPSLSEIGSRAFNGCSGLTSVTLPEQTAGLGSYAFRDCTGLQEILLPESLTQIENNAFDGCAALTSVTLPGQVTQTTPYGRDPQIAGYPVRVCEMLSALDGVALAQRVAVDSVPHIRDAKKAIRRAFENQINKRGFSIVEVISSCPTNWGMEPVKALEWLRENMLPYYPLGVYKSKE